MHITNFFGTRIILKNVKSQKCYPQNCGQRVFAIYHRKPYYISLCHDEQTPFLGQKKLSTISVDNFAHSGDNYSTLFYQWMTEPCGLSTELSTDKMWIVYRIFTSYESFE